MSRVITFSRQYPSYHPRKGEPTYFVEKMIQWYWDTQNNNPFGSVIDMLHELNFNKFPLDFIMDFSNQFDPEVNEWKGHTIRAGHRFKDGDTFKPCVWTGAPYRSLQMQFLPEIKIPKLWNIELKRKEFYINKKRMPADEVGIMAGNDGLSFVDFMHWFKYPKPFDGQIISWNENIEY